MARFQITAPDGANYEVTAPDDASEADVLSYAQQNYRSAAGADAVPDGFKPRSQMGWGEWAADVVTGSSSTQYPNAPEFLQAYMQHGGEPGGEIDPSSIMRSAVTSDTAAQLDILRKQIPGIESRQDAAGNMMLKAPGMPEWAYLNKPGFSARDVDEAGTQFLALAPFGTGVGVGGSIATRAAIGAGSMGAGSVAQDLMAGAQGSEQGVDLGKAGVSTVLGGLMGPIAGWLGKPAAAAPDASPPPPPAPKPLGESGKPVAAPPVPSPSPAPRAAPGPSLPAGEAEILTPDQSMTVRARPELVELSDLQLAQGAYQPRDRLRAEYIQEARERASRLDPQQLQPARLSDSGAPIIDDAGTILSGNGRALSISEVYSNPNLAERAAAYRASLGPDAEGMKQPVLVMRTAGMAPEEKARFADLSNRSRIAAMSATERAARDAKAAGPDVLALYQGGDFDAPQNVEFMRAFLARAVPANELPSVSKNNALTQEGVSRMRAAVLASAYDDAPTLSRMLESADDNIRGITGSMTDAAPAFAKLKAGIDAGEVMPHLDPTPAIQDAVKVVADLRSRGLTPSQYFAQMDAFDRLPASTEAWVRALYSDDLKGQLSRPQMSAMMRAYADEASKHPPGGLFPDNTTSLDVLNVARRAAGQAPPLPEGSAVAAAAAAAPEPRAAAPTPPMARADVGLPPDMKGQTNTPAQAKLPGYLLERRDPFSKVTRDDAVAASARIGEVVKHEGKKDDKLSVPISRIMASDNDLARKIGGKLREVPFTGDPLVSATRATAEGIESAVDDIAKKYGDAAKYSAGDAVIDAVKEWIEAGSSKVMDRLYKNVGGMLNKQAASPLASMRKVAKDLQGEIAESTSRVNAKALDLIEDALSKPGGMTYDGLRKLRSDIGARLSGSIIPEPGTPMPALKRIYGALSEDLSTLVYQSGGKTAHEAFRKAERVAQAMHDRRDALAKIIGAKGDAAPEKVVQRIVGMASSGGSADISKLLLARKTVGSEAWDGMVSAVVRSLGEGRDGAFSVAAYLSNYQKLSSGGRNVLFGSTGKGSLHQTLDDIATIAAKFKGFEREGNPSGTGGVVLLGSLSSSLWLHPLSGLANLAGQYALARLLAKPATAKNVAVWMRAYHAAASGNRAPLAHGSLIMATRSLANAIASETGGDVAEIERGLNAGLRGR